MFHTPPCTRSRVHGISSWCIVRLLAFLHFLLRRTCRCRVAEFRAILRVWRSEDKKSLYSGSTSSPSCSGAGSCTHSSRSNPSRCRGRSLTSISSRSRSTLPIKNCVAGGTRTNPRGTAASTSHLAGWPHCSSCSAQRLPAAARSATRFHRTWVWPLAVCSSCISSRST